MPMHNTIVAEFYFTSIYDHLHKTSALTEFDEEFGTGASIAACTRGQSAEPRNFVASVRHWASNHHHPVPQVPPISSSVFSQDPTVKERLGFALLKCSIPASIRLSGALPETDPPATATSCRPRLDSASVLFFVSSDPQGGHTIPQATTREHALPITYKPNEAGTLAQNTLGRPVNLARRIKFS